jgi:hypothetical protein
VLKPLILQPKLTVMLTASIQEYLVYRHVIPKILTVMMTVTTTRNQPRHQLQCNGKIQLTTLMGRSLLVDASVNNAQNVMQNVCTIVANMPFADDADEPFVPFIENAIINKEPDANDTNEDNEVDWLLDEPTRCILTQATTDNCQQYSINASDLAEIMSPIKPRMTQPSEIGYESKRKYFAHLPASVVKATFKHTTQNIAYRLQLTYIPERNRNSLMLTNPRIVHLLNS